LTKDDNLREFISTVKRIQNKYEESHDNSDFYKLIKMRNNELVSKLTINKWNRKIINKFLGIDILEELKRQLSSFED